MTDDIRKYADVFSAGMRVEVELPLSDEHRFRDDAKIIFIHQDLLVLQLSRDLLPEATILEIGTAIHLRSGKRGQGYRCRAILLGRASNSRFRIRLTGEVIPFNDREFFRIDVYIPLAYCARSEQGRLAMAAAEPGRSGGLLAEVGPAESVATPKPPLPVAANLSGAGVRITIPERFEIDELLDLTLYLPFGEPSTMALVGQVVHVEELSQPGDFHPLFGTALHFVALDDADREALIGFIQRLQLQQIRRLRTQPEPQVAVAVAAEVEPLLSRKMVQTILWSIGLALLFAGLVLALDNYRRHRPKGEIERTFEEQIRKIIER